MTDRTELVREISQAFVSKSGPDAPPWEHWAETVSEVLKAIEAAGLAVIPAETLAFYAEPKNYREVLYTFSDRDPAPVISDGGKKARAAQGRDAA